KQRVVFGRAIVLNPEFVVTDEPVAMVDVSIKAQILELMMDLKKEYGLTYLFISHDLATSRHVCDRIGIMYLGKIVEMADKDSIYEDPLHPYAVGLMSAIPIPDPKAKKAEAIPRGEIPSPINPPSGCRFHPRCPKAFERCPNEEPELRDAGNGRQVSCHLYD
ncbi:MAG: oligopeptide/dipeptide ABC transporter ATP-binding protein, partial [Candidatus Thorarchaeota archaeon]